MTVIHWRGPGRASNWPGWLRWTRTRGAGLDPVPRTDFNEFVRSARTVLPSDELFELISHPQRLDTLMPTELAPRERGPDRTQPTWRPRANRAKRWIARSAHRHRLEWLTVAEGCRAALLFRPEGAASVITIHLWIPCRHDAQPRMQCQLARAVRRLQDVANEALVGALDSSFRSGNLPRENDLSNFWCYQRLHG